MKRRLFLRGTAAMTILVANGEVWRAFGQDPPEFREGPAFEPWRNFAGNAKEGPLALVHAAILSSNAFNSQPWLFRVSPSKIEMYADLRRNLGAFDPYRRELYFSLGCALENLILAAPAEDYKSKITLLPGRLDSTQEKTGPQLTASIELSPGKRVTSDLYEAIPHRHTNREPFAQQSLPAAFIGTLGKLAMEDNDIRLFLFTAEKDRKTLIDIIIGSADMLADPEVRNGTAPWLRTTIDAWQASKDGAYVGEPHKSNTIEDYAKVMRSAGLFGLIAVRDRYDREQTVRAGRLWQRAHLLATTQKVAARPANGGVEMMDHEKALKRTPRTASLLAAVTGDGSWQPTFMFYMGYPTVAASASARRGVSEVLL